MNEKYPHSRRGFLWTAFGTAFSGATLTATARGQGSEVKPSGPEAAQVLRVTLDRVVYEVSGVLNGEIHFNRFPSGPTQVEWMDSFGRTVAELTLPPPKRGDSSLLFSLPLGAGLTYSNWIRLEVNDVPQVAAKSFLLSPPRDGWEDYHVVSWAHYPDGFYDQLRKAGVDATIAGREGEPSNVIDNNFRFYVEQMAPDIFSIYINHRQLWYDVVNNFSTDRENLKLWVRQPCLNDPKTDARLHERLTRYVRQHKAFRPLYYNIADELGQGWQIKANDFCHSEFCTAKFAAFLRGIYGTPEHLSREWGAGNFTLWDDTAGLWDESRLMIAHTTTDRAFDAIAVAGLQARYGSMTRLNQAWSTSFPEAAADAESLWQRWAPVMSVIRDARAVAKLDEASLEKKLGPLDAANRRWSRSGKFVNFRTWTDVLAFVNRFYAELSQIRSTTGWNVTPWCDFRNFMDQTFADAVLRAAAACKAEDPDARCATEGGQSPFPFGWYNYEQVLRADDVIEPYNGGNNVEIIRSLKPAAIMLQTVGYQYKAGEPLTDRQRLVQKQARRPLWWGLFHGHRGAIIWDNNLPDYRFVNPETRQLTVAAETYSAVFNELRRGVGALFINAQRRHDGIAIHYSPPSDQIHWLLDNLKYARQWMLHNGSDRGSHAIAVRNSWTKLIEDLGLQYEFASPQGIKAGKLNTGSYRIFLMPQSIAVSAEEVAEIREFVRTGGLVIADCRVAEMDGHGKNLGHGLLDDLFGITRARNQAVGQGIRGVADEASLHLAGASLQLHVGDETIAIAGGKALAQSGNVPLVIVNRFGQGRTIFLNLEIGDYCYQRLQADSASTLPGLVEGVLDLAEVHPGVRVLDHDGKRLPGTEIVTFSNGQVEHVAIFRNPQFDDGGWEDHPTMTAPGWAGRIDNSLFEKEAEVAIEWRAPRQCYDVRSRRALGETAVHKTTLSPWEPLIFTRSPQPIPELRVAIKPQVRAGAMLDVTLTNELGGGGPAFRVVRLEFETPSGGLYELYARNLLLRSASHTEHIPLACNDPKGRWRAHIRDVATGQSQELFFDVA